jgi:Holliday junction resolvasome RuvABC endonuclease subunit
MTVLALDLGTTTGWAVGHANQVAASGTFNLKPGRFDSAGMRFIRFRESLAKLLRGFPDANLIAFEEVRRHLGTDAAHVYGGLLATMQTFALDNGIAYEGHTVQAIKMFATGKGNASKDAVIAAVTKWGFNPIDENEADAIALCRLKLHLQSA